MQGYALGQLAAAFRTASEHEDAATRRRALERVERWHRVVDGIRTGGVDVGSRAPVRGLPTWVTLEVVRGGFATGRAVAEHPIEPDEAAVCELLGAPPSRAVVFSWLITDDGLDHCWSLLESGRYEIRLPEDAAVLTAASLLRAGHRGAALDVVDAIAPLAARLRFLPRETSVPTGANVVHRRTASEAVTLLRARTRPVQIERQREATAVWAPFGDRLVELWWSSRDEAGVIGNRLDGSWRETASHLLTTYEILAVAHPRCGRHRDRRGTTARLLLATRDAVDGRATARAVAIARTAVAQVVAKRGEPGSSQLAAVRAAQTSARIAPAHADLATIVAERLAAYPANEGLVDPAAVQGPVTAHEATTTGLPEAQMMPAAVGRILRPTRSAPVETLVADGVVPSAEVLAELVPQLTASVVADAFGDPQLGHVTAATYAAFRKRRSLLLRDRSRQVQVEELPWLAAAQRFATRSPADAGAVFRRVAGLTLDHFPQTVVPNALVQELRHLATAAGADPPLVDELAADIFTGSFSPQFARAAQDAAQLLGDTLYPRYYGYDVTELPRPGPAGRPRGSRRPSRRGTGTDLGPMCRRLAGVEAGWSVAANGSVIEWAQVVTTHNLATLVLHGTEPTSSWARLADVAWSHACSLLAQAEQAPFPLRTIKNAAYAWRQALVYACLDGPDGPAALCRRGRGVASSWPARQVLSGLEHVVAGGRFDADGRCLDGRRFVGWTTGEHWVLRSPAASVGRMPSSGP